MIDVVDEQFIGPHSYRAEGTWVQWKPRGIVSLTDAQALTVLYGERIALHGRLLLLVDLSELDKALPEARKHLVGWLKATGNGARMAVAPFGANLFAATMATLLLGAARGLGGYAPRVKICADQATARAWLTEQERILSNAKPGKTTSGRSAAARPSDPGR